LFSLCSFAQDAAVRARVAQPVDVSDRVTLHGNVHPLARRESDQGIAPDDLPMERMLLVLQRGADQEAALRQLLNDQQTQSSSRFHQWLTPERFGQQFGPADSDAQAVTNWLGGQGFYVSRVSVGRTVIEFSGTAGLVRQALGAEIHRYSVNGNNYWANAQDPQIPVALAPVVAGIASMNNFPRQRNLRPLGTFERRKSTGEVQPLFTFPSSSTGKTVYALGPTDFATIYNVLPLWSGGVDGTGQTIAVVEDSNINIQDVQAFRSIFGLPANNPQVILDGPDPGVLSGSAETEADVDVEWSGAVARGATIDLVVSQSTESTFGGDLSSLYVMDHNLAPVMSVSFGDCEAGLGTAENAFYNNLWEQGAAEGITITVSAGDTGSAGCDYAGDGASEYGLAVNGLASTPFNVALGGTDFNDAANLAQYWNATNASPSQSSALSYIPESTWNDSCAQSGALADCSASNVENLEVVAGSGGPSNCAISNGDFCISGYSKPSWQTGAGVPCRRRARHPRRVFVC
jgi:subtilase family serine protease